MATCRECKLFDLEACKDKAGRVRKTWAAKCLWKPRALPCWAAGRGVMSASAYMQPDDGHGCQCFVKRATTPQEAGK